MTVKIVNKSTNPLPHYAKKGDAGMDLRADLSNPDNIKWSGEKPEFKVTVGNENVEFILHPQSRAIIPTNTFIELPEGYEAQVRGRSGLSFEKGLDVALGTIDSPYRGNVGMICRNFTNEPITISHGERIAQMVVGKFETVEWEVVDELSESERGDNGFGHTGKE